MPTFDEVDPFSQVYSAIYDALLSASAPLAALVTRSVDLTDAGPTISNKAECADLPELLLAQTGWGIAGGSSKAYAVTQNYPVRIATSSMQITKVNQIKWAALQAMKLAGTKLGLDFVEGWTITQATDDIAKEGERRGDEKWTTVAVIVVTMKIDRAQFIPGS